ncbi:MAG: GAF and ANTAR domain-containing protein [Acidobacteria bacterium]|nr:GAF and ANTAR domain-containing protein [Acidobacteriota bacterium]
MNERIDQVTLLRQVSGIVSSPLSLDEMLGDLVGLAVRVTGCDACLVYLLDAEAGEVVLRASQVPHAADLGTLRLRLGEGVAGWVAQHRSVVALPAKAAADERFKSFPGLVEDTYQALLCVPLISAGTSIGVINIHHRAPHPHTAEEISLLSFIGEQIGSAVAKAQLAETNARLRDELETRKLVERAKGILQQRQGLSEEEAYLRLRNESRWMRRRMRELAEAIILAEDLQRKQGPPSGA